MAQRAGGLFDPEEVTHIMTDAPRLFVEAKPQAGAKPVSVGNDNPLALWLNYLLRYLAQTHPGRERASRIQPDPFALSFKALEALYVGTAQPSVSTKRLQDLAFKAALSFPGEHRSYVAGVANTLSREWGPDTVFYDMDYQSELARPNLDTLLQSIYRDRSDLVVVFLCAEYASKEWCGLEWRSIRDIIKAREDDRIMLVRFDDASIDGLFSIDGYRMMKRRLKDFAMPLLYSPHSFRVTTITDLLEQNVPREDVQHLAGHADARTTGLYDRRKKKISRNIVERISV